MQRQRQRPFWLKCSPSGLGLVREESERGRRGPTPSTVMGVCFFSFLHTQKGRDKQTTSRSGEEEKAGGGRKGWTYRHYA